MVVNCNEQGKEVWGSCTGQGEMVEMYILAVVEEMEMMVEGKLLEEMVENALRTVVGMQVEVVLHKAGEEVIDRDK